MAFSKTPTQATNQQKVIPLVYKWDQRTFDDSLGDSRIVNAIAESYKDSDAQVMHAYKREGSTLLKWRNATPPQPEHTDWGDPITGLWVNSTSEQILVLTDDGTGTTIYVGAGPSASVVQDTLNIQTITSSPTVTEDVLVTFSDFVYEDGTFATLWGINGNANFNHTSLPGGTTTQILAPGALNGDPTVLDGYVFMSAPDGTIYNSNLNDPTTWSASDFIQAEGYGDKLVRIARCGSYIVAFGTDSIEWFYDAANPTGSPLSVYQGATQRVGYLGGLATSGDVLYFLGRTTTGAVNLYKAENLKVTPIADFSMARKFLSVLPVSGIPDQSLNRGFLMTMNGHTLYVFNVADLDNPAYYYDLDLNVFGELTFKNTNRYSLNGSIMGDVPLRTQSNIFSMVGDNQLYFTTQYSGTDAGTAFEVLLQTKSMDFGTRRNKFGSRLFLWADRPVFGSPANVSWTTTDWGNFTTPRQFDLTTEYPTVWAIGQFRRISFRITFSGPELSMRFEGLEFDYDLGAQ